MDENMQKTVWEILDTVGEALEHLQEAENGELRQMAADSREKITGLLEKALSCSLEQRIHISALSDEDWLRVAYRMMDEISNPFQPRNSYDREFQSLLNYIWSHSEEELLEGIKAAAANLKKQSEQVYTIFVSYFSRYPLWGSLEPEKGDYTTYMLRAAVLKRHSYDFLWLYRRLEDYLSKRTLYAIMKNWALLDIEETGKVKSIFTDYWEPDIFPDNQGDVLVDVGAFIGDSIYSYIKMYGYGYRKIYAYEISKDSYAQLRKNIAALRLHDVVTRRKGAGRTRGEMFVESSADASANQLRRQGHTKDRVEVAPLDEDIKDEITFLKMDIEGAEQDCLLGCERIIRSQHPKLAICTYHGYEDIWKIPFMIDCMNPEYRFYLRHYGGNVIPTEFVLLCKP